MKLFLPRILTRFSYKAKNIWETHWKLDNWLRISLRKSLTTSLRNNIVYSTNCPCFKWLVLFHQKLDCESEQIHVCQVAQENKLSFCVRLNDTSCLVFNIWFAWLIFVFIKILTRSLLRHMSVSSSFRSSFMS